MRRYVYAENAEVSWRIAEYFNGLGHDGETVYAVAFLETKPGSLFAKMTVSDIKVDNGTPYICNVDDDGRAMLLVIEMEIEHVPSTEWTTDETNHWHTCEG